MKVLTVIGTRPQFIKSLLVSKGFYDYGVDEVTVHTNQHYDDCMAKNIQEELCIKPPDYYFASTAGMHPVNRLAEFMRWCLDKMEMENPDLVLVYGDCDTTLAGALTARKLSIPVAHVEAGVRSYDSTLPEEFNRIVTDEAASILFCPTDRSYLYAKDHFDASSDVVYSGDVMYDMFLRYRNEAELSSTVLERLELSEGAYVLLTIHRQENADHPERLRDILARVDRYNLPVVFPIHPRTRKSMDGLYHACDDLIAVAPLTYLDSLQLIQNAHEIHTDSGGVQREAYWAGVSVTVERNIFEWTPEDDYGMGDAHTIIADWIAKRFGGAL